MITIGILGGGQLARMLALAGKPLGLHCHFYIPEGEHCVADLGPITRGEYTDTAALEAFALSCDVITYENEHVNLDGVRALEAIKPVHPSSDALHPAQDRLFEKHFFSQHAIPTAKFQAIESHSQLYEAARNIGFPFLLKTRRGGYDGKGQWLIKSEVDINALADTMQDDEYIAEECIEFDREVSLIGVRGMDGKMKTYPLCNNVHTHGILTQTVVDQNDPIASLAQQALLTIMNALNYTGVLAVEFFVVNNTLLANEMAPRVHNSGHWSIEGAACSQFENHLRAITQLPLGETRATGQTIRMTNIIGEWPELSNLLREPYLHLHHYEKTPRPGRKLGHFTVIDYGDNPIDDIEHKISQD